MTVDVWHEHQLLKSYPEGTPFEVVDGDLHVAGDVYEDGRWSGIGSGPACVFTTPDDNCPRCHPPEEEP